MKSRTLKVFAAVILLMVLAIGILLRMNQVRVARSASGDIVRFEGHTFQRGSVRYDLPNRPIARALGKVLPEAVKSVAKWPRPETTVYAMPPFRNEPLLSAAFSVRDASGKSKRAGTRIVVSDERGQTFDPLLNSMAASGIFEVNAFPRRGREVRLRLMNDEETLAEFSIANPCRGPHPVWKPQSMPIAVTNAELEISLEKFIADIAHRKTRCVFRVRENGQESTAYLPARFEISDATGNHWYPGVAAPVRSTNGTVTGTFLGALWPDEEAWKLRVQFKPADNDATNQSPRIVEFLAKPEQVR